MEKRWNIETVDETKARELQEALSINPALCAVLVQRNIDSYQKAFQYFRPDLSMLHDPFLMKDMQKAVDRILAALEKEEKILIFGDYDVDGTTSVALVYRFLKKIYKEEFIDFYIPHRYKEGYGISMQGIDFAAKNQFSLVISLDCGIKSNALIAYANTLGIDFIVCDHHLPDTQLPPAFAILNPKQPGCAYPYKDLCGCGVGFKLVTAISVTIKLPQDQYMCYLDLVVTATAADIVPMTGENRVLAWHGLKWLNEKPCGGIKALIEAAALEEKFTLTDVVFIIAPRVNAAGRMDDARKAVQLFIEDDPAQAKAFAELLHIDNSNRREADSTITEEALALIKNDTAMLNRRTTVVYNPSWHKGVVGIVASRLIETFYRPTVVLAMGDEVVGGSARSIPGFNLYEAIHACRDHLIGYGGHFAAAGMTMHPDKIADFRDKFEEVVTATIDPALLVPVLNINTEISFSDINPGFYNIIKQMEPFGPENTKPVFITRGVINTEWSCILKEKHLRVVIRKDGRIMKGIGFNLAGKLAILQNSEFTDIVYTLDENKWNGNVSLQLKIIDIRPCSGC